MTSLRRIGLALLLSLGMAQTARAEDPSIDLKLFGKQEIEGGLSVCHLAFWQRNKNPDSDQYAYILYMPYDSEGKPTQARIEIGKEKIALAETARGDIHLPSRLGYRLYSSDDEATHVILHIMEASEEGSLITVDRARVTVVRNDLPPFVASAKGVIGCPGSSSAAATATQDAPAAESAPPTAPALAYAGPDGLPIGAAKLLASTNDVPAAVRKEIATYAPDQCSDPETLAYPGQRYQLSESSILWEVPCFLGAYQGSSVFAITQDPPGDWATLLSLPNPPALEGENNVQMMSADVKPERGLFISTELGSGGGDCGVYRVFRLMDAPGETLEFQLMEYREKVNCDGVVTDPPSWPLQFSASN
ncbi:hypothetical protein M2360_002479 [Rhizobium sp. SG_E_25_P2]|uniref:DUF1176 domain-containing protein n=1 Tax=Rhizobium sp. SG_E_25_P2 TaxID=2879942 RepID=UPI002476BCB3|nr:DUF1176 domain-containing protein [Rhizobium sp. SG_E_25_P2]MDH6267082.1 hypothetical protein [Rhizobium sp. SG_E_25_P2]